jgi:hypothetical protein
MIKLTYLLVALANAASPNTCLAKSFKLSKPDSECYVPHPVSLQSDPTADASAGGVVDPFTGEYYVDSVYNDAETTTSPGTSQVEVS